MAYRKFIAVREPSLPQRAGKALNALLRPLDELDARLAVTAAATALTEEAPVWTKKRTYRRNSDRTIVIKSIVHSEPNAEKLTRALLGHVKEIER